MAIKQIKATVRNFIFCECALCKMQMGLFILVWTYANRWAHTTRESSLIEIFASCSCVCVSIYLFSFFFSRKSYLSLLPVKGFFFRCAATDLSRLKLVSKGVSMSVYHTIIIMKKATALDNWYTFLANI